MKFNDRLKELRQGRKLTQEEFAKLSGISRSAIGMYESGRREPNFKTLELIADFFNVDMDYLLGKSDTTTQIQLPAGTFKPVFKKVPLLGYVAAGKPLDDLNQDVSYVDVDGRYNVDFAVKVVGDSMIDIDINDGDIVFAKSMPEVENGQIGVVEIDHEKACLKRFYRSNDTITLISANPKYPPMVFNAENCESVTVRGLAVIKQSEIH